MLDAIKRIMDEKAARRALAKANGLDPGSVDYHAFVTLGIEPNPPNTGPLEKEDSARPASSPRVGATS